MLVDARLGFSLEELLDDHIGWALRRKSFSYFTRGTFHTNILNQAFKKQIPELVVEVNHRIFRNKEDESIEGESEEPISKGADFYYKWCRVQGRLVKHSEAPERSQVLSPI